MGSSCSFKIISWPSVWFSLGITQALKEKIYELKLQHLELPHYDILGACVPTTMTNDEEQQSWLDLFKELQNLLYVGLCDEDFCSFAAEVLLKFFTLLQAEALKVIVLCTIIILVSHCSSRV